MKTWTLKIPYSIFSPFNSFIISVYTVTLKQIVCCCILWASEVSLELGRVNDYYLFASIPFAHSAVLYISSLPLFDLAIIVYTQQMKLKGTIVVSLYSHAYCSSCSLSSSHCFKLTTQHDSPSMLNIILITFLVLQSWYFQIHLEEICCCWREKAPMVLNIDFYTR